MTRFISILNVWGSAGRRYLSLKIDWSLGLMIDTLAIGVTMGVEMLTVTGQLSEH